MEKSLRDPIQIIKSDTTIPCTRPWTSLEERSLAGDYRICCFINADLGTLGKTEDRDILELWQGKPLHRIRESFAEGMFQRFCPPDCPVLLQKSEIQPDYTDFNDYDPGEYATFSAEFRENRERVVSAILRREKTVDTFPLRLKLHPTNICNLRCRMCMQDKDARADIGEGYHRNLHRLMPYLEELIVFGGEPFACPVTKGIIFGDEMRQHPHIHYSAISNGCLLDEAIQEKLKRLRLGWFSFSLDSCVEKTYEQIRINAKYSRTFPNIESFVRKRDRGEIRIRSIEANFVIQKLNYTEISRFVEFAHDLGINSGFGLITGFNELHDRIDEVRASLEEGISKAQSLGEQAVARQLSLLHRQLPRYGAKVRRLRLYYRLMDLVDKDRLMFFLRRHNRLREFLKKVAGVS